MPKINTAAKIHIRPAGQCKPEAIRSITLVGMVNCTSIGSAAFLQLICWNCICGDPTWPRLSCSVNRDYHCHTLLHRSTHEGLLNTVGSHTSSGQACPTWNDVPSQPLRSIFSFLFFSVNQHFTFFFTFFSMWQKRRRQLRVFDRDSGNVWLPRVSPKAWAPPLGFTPTGSSWGRKEPTVRRRRELCCCSYGPHRWVRYVSAQSKKLDVLHEVFFFSPWIQKKCNRSTTDSEHMGALFSSAFAFGWRSLGRALNKRNRVRVLSMKTGLFQCAWFFWKKHFYVISVKQVRFRCESGLLLPEMICLFMSGDSHITNRVTSLFPDKLLHQTHCLVNRVILSES